MEKLNLFKKEDYSERMKEILDEAWYVFRHQFITGMIMTETKNEALFQFHFASIIKTVGNLYAFSDERFYVDLETKWEGEKGKKFIDITCGFKENDAIRYACAIELKFKPRREDSKKTAFPNNMFRIYRDLEFLEREVGIGLEKKPEGCSLGKQIYSEGRFYFITDNKMYAMNGTAGTIEDDFHWRAETGTFGFSYPDHKYLSRFNFRMQLAKGASMDFYMQYDSDGIWRFMGHMEGIDLRTFTLPIRPRRCDHLRMAIDGTGEFKLYSIARILEVGSDE